MRCRFYTNRQLIFFYHDVSLIGSMKKEFAYILKPENNYVVCDTLIKQKKKKNHHVITYNYFVTAVLWCHGYWFW
jgi:hypothetical protein